MGFILIGTMENLLTYIKSAIGFQTPCKSFDRSTTKWPSLGSSPLMLLSFQTFVQ
jgi:hypothetical protein